MIVYLGIDGCLISATTCEQNIDIHVYMRTQDSEPTRQQLSSLLQLLLSTFSRKNLQHPDEEETVFWFEKEKEVSRLFFCMELMADHMQRILLSDAFHPKLQEEGEKKSERPFR